MSAIDTLEHIIYMYSSIFGLLIVPLGIYLVVKGLKNKNED